MPKRVLYGQVVSDKQNKTIVVKVQRIFQHALYKKRIRKSKRYQAHDPNEQFRIGDFVHIVEHAPISKTKHWLVRYETESK